MPEDDSGLIKILIWLVVVVVLIIIGYFVVSAIESWIHNTSVLINNWVTQNAWGIMVGFIIAIVVLVLGIFLAGKLRNR